MEIRLRSTSVGAAIEAKDQSSPSIAGIRSSKNQEGRSRSRIRDLSWSVASAVRSRASVSFQTLGHGVVPPIAEAGTGLAREAYVTARITVTDHGGVRRIRLE